MRKLSPDKAVMTQPPNVEDQPNRHESEPPPQQLSQGASTSPHRASSGFHPWRVLGKVSLVVGGILLIGGAGGAYWCWRFVQRELAPTVAQALTTILSRPIEIGQLEQISLHQLRFGASVLPPTATDPDRVTVKAIEVGFNPWEALTTRTVKMDITLVQPSLYLKQEQNGQWVNLKLNLERPQGPFAFQPEVLRFKQAELTLVPYPVVPPASVPPPTTPPKPSTPILVSGINGEVALPAPVPQGVDPTHLPSPSFQFRVEGQTAAKAKLKAEGDIQMAKVPVYRVDAQVQHLPLVEMGSLIPSPIAVQSGQLTAHVEVRGKGSELPDLQGTAQLQNVAAKLPQAPLPLNQVNGKFRFKGQQVTLENLGARYGLVPIQAKGTVHLKSGYQVTAQIPATSIAALTQTLGTTAPIPLAGTLKADLNLTGELTAPTLAGEITTTERTRVDRVLLNAAQVNFKLNSKEVLLTQIRATPLVGGEITGKGQINLQADRQGLVLDFFSQGVPADAIAKLYGSAPPVAIGAITASAQIFGPFNDLRTVVNWQAPHAVYPGQGELAIRTVGKQGSVVTLSKTFFEVEGGVVEAQAQLANGQWHAALRGNQVQLSRFNPQLRGVGAGVLTASGRMDSFQAKDIRAEGEFLLSQGVSVINKPLTAKVGWNGQALQLKQVVAEGFNLAGDVQVALTPDQPPQLTELALAVQVKDLDLASLPVAVPPSLQVAGQANFSGDVKGTLAAPEVQGSLQLHDFAVNQLTFEPVLAGAVDFGFQKGLDLQLAGVQDAIALNLDAQYQPKAFRVQFKDSLAQGQTQGDQLQVNIDRFPLGILALAPARAVGLGTVTGKLSAEASLNLQKQRARGTVTIANPGIGQIQSDQLTGQFNYADGVASLTEGSLKQGKSLFLLSGQFAQGADPTFQGQVKIAEGHTQDILHVMQWFEVADLARGIQPPTYGHAEDVNPQGVTIASLPTFRKIQRFAEIQALLAQQQQARREASRLPDLTTLVGAFKGDINLTGSLQKGVKLDFNVLGQDWRWGDYVADEVEVRGEFANNVLTFLPLRLQGGDTLLTFAGQIGGEDQSGQLVADNVPVDAIDYFFPLPVDLTGKIDASAALAGSVTNPQARGEIKLVEGTLNGEAIEEAQGGFSYADARFSFGTTLRVNGPEPISMIGSVPFQIPGTSVAPDSDQLSLDLNVKDSGLAFINVLTPQVAWVDGKGDVKLQVRGTLTNPIATGIAQFENTTLKAQALPEPLTNVQGTVKFDRDRIRVEEVRGDFSGGEVVVSGVLPIVQPMGLEDPDAANPLHIDLEGLALNFKGVYQGTAQGRVQILGSAFSPVIGGDIDLKKGFIFLADTAPSETIPTSSTLSSIDYSQPTVRFEDLDIELMDNMWIVSPPILNFLATGNLSLNGTIDNLQPSGTIRLRKGQVNLFTSQFVLASGHEQTATFIPNRGLDPVLDVTLVTTASEVTRTPIPTSSVPEVQEDISVTALGALQTVRVEATVQGPASELADNLTLTSSPSRSQIEIISLLGGSFVDTLGRGGTTLALANLAGSALLTNIQSAIGNALGLTEFRLFPAVTTSGDKEERSTDSTLGLGAELGVDITGRLSASILSIVTGNQPPQFNIRYRVNDQTRLRGSTDFNGDSRAVIEYENRF